MIKVITDSTSAHQTYSESTLSLTLERVEIPRGLGAWEGGTGTLTSVYDCKIPSPRVSRPADFENDIFYLTSVT